MMQSVLLNCIKDNIVRKGEFKTLQEKARKNKEIEKLYGAAHFYFGIKMVCLTVT